MIVTSTALLMSLLLLPCQSVALSLHLSICRFKEPVGRVLAFVERARASLPQVHTVSVFLWQSVDFIEEATLLAEASAWPAAWTVAPLRNVAREAHCHLAYLSQHRAASSDFVWFAHGLPDFYMEDNMWPRLPLLSNRTGVLALGGQLSCGCSGDGTLPDGAPMTHLREVYALSLRRFCYGRWTAFANGWFVVSRRRIRAQPRWLYSMLLDRAEADADNLMDRLQFTPNAVHDGGWVFGAVMERAWALLFQCTDMGRCCEPVRNETCLPEECQCLDEPGHVADHSARKLFAYAVKV